jgi:hypothetical protein
LRHPISFKLIHKLSKYYNQLHHTKFPSKICKMARRIPPQASQDPQRTPEISAPKKPFPPNLAPWSVQNRCPLSTQPTSARHAHSTPRAFFARFTHTIPHCGSGCGCLRGLVGFEELRASYMARSPRDAYSLGSSSTNYLSCICITARLQVARVFILWCVPASLFLYSD